MEKHPRRIPRKQYPYIVKTFIFPKRDFLELNTHLSAGWKLIDIINNHRALNGVHYLLGTSDTEAEIPEKYRDYTREMEEKWEAHKANAGGFKWLLDLNRNIEAGKIPLI